MHKVFDLTRQPPKEKEPHLESMNLPEKSYVLHVASNSWAALKNGFWLFGTASSKRRCRLQRFLKGQQERREVTKKVKNSNADCCTLRKRIT